MGQWSLPSFDEVKRSAARFVPGTQTSWGERGSGGGAPKPPANPAGAGGGGGPKATPVHDAIRYIRSQAPGMNKKQARRLFNQFQTSQMNPGLGEFVQSQVNTPNPNVMQAFFADTVAPYLKETGAKYQQGAEAGTKAMQSILSGAAPSPAIDVLKSFLPLQAAGDKKMGAALEAATVTAPYYDQLLTQLQENIAQQQRSQFYSQQLAAGGAAPATEDSVGAQIVAGLVGKG